MTEVNKTIQDRDTRYGGFKNVALTEDELMGTLESSKNWEHLPSYMRCALRMIVHKIARIMNGDPFYVDNWHDIQGYGKLAEDLIKKESQNDPEEKVKAEFIYTPNNM